MAPYSASDVPLTTDPRGTIDDRQLVQAGYRFALSLTHSTHQAEDLIQQACLKTLRSRGYLVGKAYLFVAIRRLYYDSIKSNREHLADHEQLAESMAAHEPDHTVTVDQRLDMNALLSRLRPEEREALYLNCVEGYTAAEIAELTDRPRNTVLSLLSRAKKRLTARQTSVQPAEAT